MVWQRTTVYGNQMTMWMRKFTSWGLVVALCLVGQAGCAPRLAPATPAGVALSPGRYLTAYYRAPDFTPAQATYVLTPFEVETAQGVAADTFQALFMEELTQAWRANGLKLSDPGRHRRQRRGAICGGPGRGLPVPPGQDRRRPGGVRGHHPGGRHPVCLPGPDQPEFTGQSRPAGPQGR